MFKSIKFIESITSTQNAHTKIQKTKQTHNTKENNTEKHIHKHLNK